MTAPCVSAVPDDATRRLAADLLDTMYAAPGRGLAAPQVGTLTRLFVMDATWKEGVFAPLILLNPVVEWRADTLATGPEACLSLPGITTMIARATELRLRWTDLDGATQMATLTGFAAICAQHEYDHLDGILTLDHLDDGARAAALAALA